MIKVFIMKLNIYIVNLYCQLLSLDFIQNVNFSSSKILNNKNLQLFYSKSKSLFLIYCQFTQWATER